MTAPFWRLDGGGRTLVVLPGLAERSMDPQPRGSAAPVRETVPGGVGAGVPRAFWFGETLGPIDDVEALLALDETTVARNAMNAPEPLTLCPEAGQGWMGSPGLAGHRDGRRFAHRWTLARVTPMAGEHGSALSFELSDRASGLELELHLDLDDDSGVLSARSALVNVGDDDFTIDWLASATVALPTGHAELLLQHGRWGREFQETREPIGIGRRDVANASGRHHEYVPFAMTGTPGFDNTSGDVLAAHLAWSGNFSLRMERLSDGLAALQAGVLPVPGELRLGPGKRFETPALHVATGTGMNACSRRLHEYARRRVLPAFTRTPRPIHANSWEALYFDHDADALGQLVDSAAALGAERFVLDDGWFERRRGTTAGLGDWSVDPGVYPKGLGPVVARVRGHGMQFGLWFEPEMVNPDSALFETHPDWVLRVDGIDTPLSRNQLVLDIARDDVRAYLLERLVSLVREYRIDYIKWDYNRNVLLAGDGERGRAAAQPAALYRLLDDLLDTCPGLEVETCASGGGRADFGVLARTGRVWASDNIDPVSRTHIQAGFQRFLPPEIMGAHVGHEHAHVTGRATSLHTRAIVALQGQFGFELDARRLDEAERSVLHHYTELYRTHREWLAESVYHRLDVGEESLVASALVSCDGRIALVTVVAVAESSRARPERLRLPFLEGPGAWRVSLESANAEELAPFSQRAPAWVTAPTTTTGDLLARVGLPLPVLTPQAALLIGCRLQAR